MLKLVSDKKEDIYSSEVGNGVTYHYLNGKLHREDGPAVEYPNGSKEWWVCGQRHREDGPAIDYIDGEKYWYIHGKLHREDGPAVDLFNGTQEWWINDELHREDGPAIINFYCNEWWLNGKPHREDGPAKEYKDGRKEWWLNGKKILKTRIHEQVYEFHKAGNLPISYKPTIPSDDRVKLRAKLILEEAFEMLESCFSNEEASKEADDMFEKAMTLFDKYKINVDLVEFADSLGDIDYVVEGGRIEFGIDGKPIMDEIQRTNMAKFGPGSWKDETGKVRKPPDWKPPNIKAELEKQGWKDGS